MDDYWRHVDRWQTQTQLYQGPMDHYVLERPL